jgi:hypothetical protein
LIVCGHVHLAPGGTTAACGRIDFRAVAGRTTGAAAARVPDHSLAGAIAIETGAHLARGSNVGARSSPRWRTRRCDKPANYLAEPISRGRLIRGLRVLIESGAKLETAARMFEYDGHDRRKNPANPMVRDWRRVLQNEWEADKRRREKHREEPRRERPGASEPIGDGDPGAGGSG